MEAGFGEVIIPRGSIGSRGTRLARRIRSRLLRVPATAVLWAAVFVAGILLVYLGSRLTFWADEWFFLLHRSEFTADTLLAPHNSHLTFLLVLLYQVLQDLFGISSSVPYHLASVGALLGSVVMVFLYLRRRVGDWLAVAGAVPILFLGSGWIQLLFPFQLGFAASAILGIGALLALERDDRRGDRTACLLITLSLLWSSLGLAFLVGAVVNVLARRKLSGSWYVFAIPVALYAAWWLGWGRDQPSAVSFANLISAPKYVLEGLASSLSGLLGLGGIGGWELGGQSLGPLDWLVFVVVVAYLAAHLWRRRPRTSPSLLTIGSVLLSFWVLAALASDAFRPANTSRYVYMGVVILVLAIGEILRGIKPRRSLLVGVYVVLAAAVAGNLVMLGEGYRFYSAINRVERSATGALEIARDTVDPGFELGPVPMFFGFVTPATYFPAVDAGGSPAYSPAAIATTPELTREATDRTLADALRIELTPIKGHREQVALRGCQLLTIPPGGPGSGASTALPAGGAALRAGAGTRAQIRLGRFATAAFPVVTGELGAGEAARLAIPADAAAERWRLRVVGSGKVDVCALPPG